LIAYLLRKLSMAITVNTVLFISQVMRVYYDRLVDDTDKSWLFGYMDEVTHGHLDIQFNLLFHHLDSDGDGKVCSFIAS